MAEHISLEDLLASDGVPNLAPPEPAKEEVPTADDNFLNRPFYVNKMMKTIEEVKEYSWNRGEIGGLDWGFESFNKAFEGLNTGVHLIAGQSNIGKSGMCMQLAWQIAQANKVIDEKHPKKAFVLYFSLDDNNNELLPRLIAIDQRIPINAVRFPKKYEDNEHYMERMEIGYERLIESSDLIHMLDVNEGSSIEYIEATAEKYALELAKQNEDYQIVLFIDNFHDITVDDKSIGNDESSKYNHIADLLTRMATKFDCPIVCTAEFRKLNGNRRPKLDDIRESTKIGYEAKAILLCYNEVGLRGQQSNIYWMRDEKPDKQPVYEAHVGKNKFGSYKGRLYFEFIPEMSYFREVGDEGAQRYSQMVSG